MKTKKGFTLIELLVVISIIALLLSILMPSLSKAKSAAQDVMCNTNMHQMGLAYSAFTSSNKDRFDKGWIDAVDGSGLWMKVMKDYFGTYDVLTCPKTARNNNPDATKGVWGPFKGGTGTWTDAVAGAYGSYGQNWYVTDRTTGLYGAVGQGSVNFWRTTGHKRADTIPVLGDAWWYCATPNATNPPPPFKGDKSGGQDNATGGMNRFCVDRHNGYSYILFMDWSSRKVGLKELWTLRWHKSFDIRNSWTLAGNGGDVSRANSKWDAAAPWMSRYPVH